MLLLVWFSAWRRRAGIGTPSTPCFQALGRSWQNQAGWKQGLWCSTPHKASTRKLKASLRNSAIECFRYLRPNCVELLPGRLAQIQAEMVTFFWDGVHRVPQTVFFYLIRLDQGLDHLTSRAAIFQICFVIRFLRGPPDWCGERCSSTFLGKSIVWDSMRLFLTDFVYV